LVACSDDTQSLSDAKTVMVGTVEAKPEPTMGASSETAPVFELTDTSGDTVSLSTLLSQNRQVVLVFYRGHF